MWLSVDEKDSRPIYLQIVSQVKEQVLNGGLKTGDELPSVRELGNILAINLHTVRAAYLRLRDEGIINLHLGRRATVAGPPRSSGTAEMVDELKRRLEEIITDALLKGLTAETIRKIVDRHLEDRER
ncbi:MAG: GntR family transcriptional regulator [Dehalococcoidales bacterium]|nr:GntR family transcriptional regulator [Dehalococcoidales bacterium]